MTGYLAKHGATLVDNGYRVLPIVPRHKSPGRYSNDEWKGYGGWTRHCDRDTTALELEVWESWPDAGIGIACGNVAALDIDVLDATLVHQVRDLALRVLGATPLVRQGRAPKLLLVYRTETPFAAIKAHPLEILCQGQQFVAYGIHPVTQREYTWIDEQPTDVDISRLPVITEAQAKDFMRQALALLPEEMRRAPTTTGGAAHQRGDLRGTLPAITAALEWVPNADLQWDDWWRIGMATKGALGDEGWPVFSAWSGQSTKHNPTTTWSTWRSMKPHSIGAGTIYDAAINAGWSPEPGLILNGEIQAALDYAGVPLAEDLLDDDEPLDIDPVQVNPVNCTDAPLATIDELLQVEGVLKEFIEWCGASAYRRQPWLALGAGIAMVGALAGRRYRNARNTRTNVYVVGMADSGGGKENARSRVKELLYEATLERYMGGDEVASGKALLSALQVHPARLFQIDEFGQELNQMLSAKAPTHRREIWTSLTKLYTSSSSVFLGTEYADQKERPRVDLQQPHACLHGTTVPGPFWAALQSGALSDGSLARFLIFISPDSYPDGAADRAPPPPPRSLIEACQAISLGPQGHDFGAMDNPHGMSASVRTEAYVVPYDRGATMLARRLADEQTEALRQHAGSPQTATIARRLETAERVALIRAISRDPQAPVVTQDTLEWAWQLVRYCQESSREEIEANVADNQHEAAHLRVLRIIKEAMPIGIPTTELKKKMHWAGGDKQKEDLLRSLEESRSIESFPMPPERGIGRPKKMYRIWDGISGGQVLKRSA